MRRARRPRCCSGIDGLIIALASAERDGTDLAGLALSGPLGVAHLADRDRLEAAVAAGVTADEPCDALRRSTRASRQAGTEFDWLSRDPAEVDAYLADPLCGNKMPLTDRRTPPASSVWPSGARAPRPGQVPDGLPVLLLSGRARSRSAGTTPPRSPRWPTLLRAPGPAGGTAGVPRRPARGLQRDQPRRGHRRSDDLARRAGRERTGGVIRRHWLRRCDC